MPKRVGTGCGVHGRGSFGASGREQDVTARIVAVMAATSLLVPIACGDTTEDLADELVDRAKAAVTARDYEMAAHHARTALGEDPTSREAEIIVTYADYGDQMLHGAFWENDQAAIELLADIVADIDVVDDRFGAPVLVLAAAWGTPMWSGRHPA